MAVIPPPTTYINTRLLDGNKERLNTLTPLRGYAIQPYLSIKDAVKPLHGLVDDIDSRVWTATNRCKDPNDTLTHDESAAIILYTIEWDPGHPSLYSILNETLRLEDRDRLVPFFPYLKLLLSGLFKLPSVQCTIWRGIRGDLSSNYKVDEFYTWWAFSSCTTSMSVLANNDRYLGQTSSCTLFAIECLNGKNIKRHSYFAQEDEVLLLPCTYFQVIDNLSRRDGLHIIHLREVPPPYMLLEPPFPISRGSTSHHLDGKQSQVILEQLTKEKKHLEEQCGQHQIQIGILQSDNEVLKKRCVKYEEEICNITEIIFHANEENECLQQEVERVNQENQHLREENERLKQRSQHLQGENELFRPEIEPQDHSMIEIQETAEHSTAFHSITSDVKPNKAYRYTVLVIVHGVDASGTRFTIMNDLYVNIHFFSIHKQTRLMAPSFPLLIGQDLYFEKIFQNCIDLSDIIGRLEHEQVLIELCQTTSAQPIVLATYETTAKDFLYPYSCNRIEYTGFRRDILLNRTVNLADISPSFAFSTSSRIDEIFDSIEKNSAGTTQ